MVLGKLDIPMQKDKIEPLFYTTQKSIQNGLDLHVRPRNVKLSEKTKTKTKTKQNRTGGKSHDFGLGTVFHEFDTKCRGKYAKLDV